MNNLLILLDDKNCCIKTINENNQTTITLENLEFSIIRSKEGLIAFIDWYFDSNDKLLKIDINLLNDYESENFENYFMSNNLKYEHEFNKIVIELGNINNISESKTIYQTFSNSNFIKKNDLICGFLLDLNIIYLENEFITINEGICQ